MVSRDTHGFAMKATWAQINGKGHDLFKQPKTDPSKNSAKGRFTVIADDEGHYVLSPEHPDKDEDCMEYYYAPELKVALNTFDMVRQTAKTDLMYGEFGDA